MSHGQRYNSSSSASAGVGNNESDSGPYLVTFFGMDAQDETLRMMHFLQHYVDKLGVLPERCIFVLHSRHGEKAIAKGARNRITETSSTRTSRDISTYVR
jgi:hypothetical protein